MNRVHIDKGAAIYRLNGCPVWKLDLNIPGRPRRRISLRTTAKENALLVARHLVQEVLAESWSISLPRDIAFDDLLKIYEGHAKARNTERTVEVNLQILRRFKQFAAEKIGDGRKFLLSHSTPDLLESYVQARKAEGLNAWTINRHLGTLSTFFNFARRSGFLRSNPVERIQRLPVVRNRVPRTLEPDQIRKLIDESSRPISNVGPGRKGNGTFRQRVTPLRDLIFFALNTGARLGEMLYMEWSDVDFDRGLIYFRCKPEHTIKDREERTVRANDALLEMLRRRRLVCGTTRWVFPNAKGGILGRENALRELKIVARRVGIPEANFQMMRRTFLRACAENGMPSFVLKALAGHSSVRTTEQYYVGAIAGTQWRPPVIGA
ncbi:MAG: tyrosine-type recombinase/integrase [Planctomycetes bacterium]|nr:tyrosine-type recombinase/integrase [Planctomycetota bacterium]